MALVSGPSAFALKVQALVLRVQGLVLRVQGLASKVHGLALGVQGLVLALRIWPQLHHWKSAGKTLHSIFITIVAALNMT